MKGLIITKPIHAKSRELQLMRNLKPADHIDLRRCTFVCSEALGIVKNHPARNKMLSDEVVELIEKSEL